MSGDGAGDETGAVVQERLQVFDMQRAVLAHAPPVDLGAIGLERQPGGDIGVMVHVGDDDLVTLDSSLAMPRLTRRMNEVAFMPKEISSGR